MQSKLRSLVFLVFQKISQLLRGKWIPCIRIVGLRNINQFLRGQCILGIRIGCIRINTIRGFQPVQNFLFRLLWPRKPVIEVQGSKMYVNPEGLPQSFEKTFQFYTIFRNWGSFPMTEIFKKVVKQGDIVVDVGASLGFYTLLAAKLVGEKGKVYAFEPEPTNYSLLLKNIEINGYDNVIAVQKAVFSTTGTIRLFLDPGDVGGHSLYQSDGSRKSIEIESITLDEFFESKEQRIDVIKMDIEGAEQAAFLGMERILRENENLKMFIEFFSHWIRRSGGSPEEFAGLLLEDYHFSIVDMGDGRGLNISNPEKLVNFLGERVGNLFLERK